MAYSLQPKGFDYQKLSDVFNEICPDFYDAQSNGKSLGIGFALKVLFRLSPEMRLLKKIGEDKMWCIRLPATKKTSATSVYIYTHRFEGPINVQPRVKKNKLYLTLKQASLLAVAKLCREIPNDIEMADKVLLTPLARAIFQPQTIPKISVDLSRLLGRPVHISEVLKVIISSCQLGGFHLEYSACHVAVVAVTVTSAHDTNRHKIRAKTIRAYEQHHKVFDPNQYEIYLRHSKLAGVEPKNAVETCEIVELSAGKQGEKKHARKNESLCDAIDRIFGNVTDPSVSVTPVAPQSLPKTTPGSECLQVAEEQSLNVDITPTAYKDLKAEVIKKPDKSNAARAERSTQQCQWPLIDVHDYDALLLPTKYLFNEFLD